MQESSRLELTSIRDLKPAMKNLNMVFIVLEIGNYHLTEFFLFKTLIFNSNLHHIPCLIHEQQEEQM